MRKSGKDRTKGDGGKWSPLSDCDRGLTTLLSLSTGSLMRWYRLSRYDDDESLVTSHCQMLLMVAAGDFCC